MSTKKGSQSPKKKIASGDGGGGHINPTASASSQPQFIFQVMPEPTYLDRTTLDRIRFLQRIRPQINKDHIKELLRRGGDFLHGMRSMDSSALNGGQYSNFAGLSLPIAGASLPIGVGEPHWRPGRDRNGSGGGGPDASDDPGDLVFLPISWEDLAELLSVLFDLPFLLAKEEEQILAYTIKVRGIKSTGPESRLDDEATFIARLERFRATLNARPQDFPDLVFDQIPTSEEFPYDQEDMRYKRIEEKWDPDSKAVVFFEFDTSGSMGGEPMAIAKFFFLLQLIWLKARYGEVSVVYIPHNAAAFRVESEREFFAITESGGTMFTPAHELVMSIAAAEFPAEIYNRYAFHATDGFNFESPSDLAQVIEEMVTEGKGDFNLFGYLEISPYGGDYVTDGMKALDLLSDRAQLRVGKARVKSQDEVPDALRQILKIETTTI